MSFDPPSRNFNHWLIEDKHAQNYTYVPSAFVLGHFYQIFSHRSKLWLRMKIVVDKSMFPGHVFGRPRDRDTRKLEPGRFLVPFGLQPCGRLSTTEHHHSRHRHRRRDKIQGRPARHQIRILVVL